MEKLEFEAAIVKEKIQYNPTERQAVIDPGFYSFITISWLWTLILKSRKGSLIEGDVPDFAERDKAQAFEDRFAPFWQQLDKSFKDPSIEKPSLFWHIFWIIKWRGLAVVLGSFIYQSLFLGYPFLLSFMITYLTSDPLTMNDAVLVQNGFFLTAGLCLCGIGQQFGSIVITMNEKYMSASINAILAGAILEKELRGSNEKFSKANILNFINQDIGMAQQFTLSFKLVSIPVFVAFDLSFLCRIFGLQVVYTFVFLAFLTFIDGALWKKRATYQGVRNKLTKSYISILKEFIEAITSSKVMIREVQVMGQINQFRDMQVGILGRLADIQGVTMGMERNLSSILACFLFSFYVLSGNVLTPAILFPAYIFLNVSDITGYISFSYAAFLSGQIGLANIEPFLVSEEIGKPKNCVDELCGTSHAAIISRSLTFGYVGNTEAVSKTAFKLWCGSLKVEKGFTGLTGRVGSGKSTFLGGLLGFVAKETGDFILNGKIAYVSQVPFLMEGTILSNITFFKENIDERLLSNVIEWCALTRDLSLLPNGIMTKVGEQGVNLSGGQKARICLARALYHDADIYLLDDPLSSSDTKVAQHIFHSLKKNLKDKTVIMVTHNELQLSQMDGLIQLEEGRVASFGAVPEELREKFKSAEDEDELTESMSLNDVQKQEKTGKKLDIQLNIDEGQAKDFTVVEEREVGAVTFASYKSYFSRMTTFNSYGFIISFILDTTTNILAPLCSAYLCLSTDLHYQQQWITPFIVLTLVSLAVSIIAFLFYFRSGIAISSRIFREAITAIVNAPISFVQGSPKGRIINRMTSDVTFTDLNTSNNISQTLNYGAVVLSSFILICWGTGSPFVPLLLLGLIIFGTFLNWYIAPAIIESQRYASLASSSFTTLQNETLNGMEILKAFGVENEVKTIFYRELDNSNSSAFCQTSLNAYFELRLGVSGSLIVLLLCITGMLKRGSSDSFGIFISLALQNAVSFSNSIECQLRSINWLNAKMNSFERLRYYATSLPMEPPHNIEGDPVKEVWPLQGGIKFKGLTLAYEQRSDHAIIKDFSLVISPGEKVGIVGRTGSGKSTLISSFFRFMEAKAGSLEIDGLDVSSLGLQVLRRAVSLIPQEAVLFEGTVRSNVDSRDEYSDLEIWNALDQAGLKGYITSLDGQLDAKILPEGSNISHGQRQLICLARAVISNPKILIMDEATSSIDSAGDERIQALIKTNFQKTTVLSIAHRLSSVSEYDQILVLHEGRLMEYGPPSVLLQDPNSHYSKLVAAASHSTVAAS